jgi:hypothetical protein
MADRSDDRVGYGKPPRHSRFRKGQSGNPKGRPKGTRNLKTDLLEELQATVLVTEGVTKRRLSKQRAVLKSLTAKAINGDVRAVNTLLSLMARLLDLEGLDTADNPITADDAEILKAFERRLLQGARTPTDATVSATKSSSGKEQDDD